MNNLRKSIHYLQQAIRKNEDNINPHQENKLYEALNLMIDVDKNETII